MSTHRHREAPASPPTASSPPTARPRAEDWPDVAAADFWEERYAGSDQVWSGRANRTVTDVAAGLTPGRALDLGCGEGADVIWLARHGWDATGVDISPTAVRRATAAAETLGLAAEVIRFHAADLSSWTAGRQYDLVTASFLHSPVQLPREAILRRAAELVAPGGHLLVVAHAAPPPWSTHAHEHEGGPAHQFPTPQEELDVLALDPTDWSTAVAEIRSRTAADPDGREAVLEDSVLLLRRR